MKRLVSISIMLIITILTLTLSGCSSTSSSQGASSPQPGENGGAVEAPAAEGPREEGPAAGEDNQKDNGEGKIVEPDPNSEEVECDWVIKINDKAKVQTGPILFDVNLRLLAEKKGGKDAMGIYNGAVTVILKGDPRSVDEGIVAGSLDGIGTDKAVSFVLGEHMDPVPLVSPPPGQVSVAPLIKPDYYDASGTFNFSASSTTDIVFVDEQGQEEYHDAKAFSGKRDYYIEVDGLTATIEVTGIGTFKGTCEGIPVSPVK